MLVKDHKTMPQNKYKVPCLVNLDKNTKSFIQIAIAKRVELNTRGIPAKFLFQPIGFKEAVVKSKW